MLYKKNEEKQSCDRSFAAPAAEYRAAPFWAWNGKLNETILHKQIDAFKTMGFGGFHIHVRFGLEDEYFGETFQKSVVLCVEKAKRDKMLVWLYDEDRWPSGCAGGLVTTRPCFRHKDIALIGGFPERYMVADGTKNEDYEPLLPIVCAAYAVQTPVFAKGGKKYVSYRRIPLPEAHGAIREEEKKAAFEQAVKSALKDNETLYLAVIFTKEASDWYNGAAYSDNFNEMCVQQFIALTHERYKRLIGSDFGNTVPCIFSDEPNIEPERENSFAWSNDFPAQFTKYCGEDIFARLPLLFPEFAWISEENAREFRYKYYDFIAERFAHAYARQIGAWCGKNGIAFTGHYLCEDSLSGQLSCSGDVMAQYLYYDFPGVDMLCDEREYITAVQVKSVANQAGKEAVMCELYGSTNWDFDFRGFKLQGDWLAAMGVTVRVPHLAWYTMKGEGKRDYPASIGIQANWYKEFSLLEDRFARLNACLTRGREIVRVGVVHTVESAWISEEPERKKLTEELIFLSESLYRSGVNFDFIDEKLLTSQADESRPRNVGLSRYDAVLLPRVHTLRKSTLTFLERFVTDGGELISMQEDTFLLDGKNPEEREKGRIRALLQRAAFVKDASSAAERLNKYRFLSVVPKSGETGVLISRAVRDGDKIWLFICRADKPDEKYEAKGFSFLIDGAYSAKEYDTSCGEIRPFTCEVNVMQEGGGGKKYVTRFDKKFYAHDGILLLLSAKETAQSNKKSLPFCAQNMQKGRGKAVKVSRRAELVTDEENVLLLDRATVFVNGVTVCKEEETLRLDKKTREYIGMKPRDFFSAQPWTKANGRKTTTPVTVRFTFLSEEECNEAFLAAELSDVTKIELNGKDVPVIPCGIYVDDAISRVRLPSIKKGENALCLYMNYSEQSSLENVFIAGNFETAKTKKGCGAYGGEKGKITRRKKTKKWSRLDGQGFTFYGGNVEYKANFYLRKEGSVRICVPHFKGNLIKVWVDGAEAGNILFAPYETTADQLSAGKHELRLKLYGNRFNTFGQLHNTTSVKWDGAYAWRTSGKEWTYCLRTRPVGILGAPIVQFYPKKEAYLNDGKRI